ncbi:MAG: 5'-deoxynucleotidase [Clostridia bacterium]|nr:5'-deoxynucleotidase [Clostridia bacterium]
MGNFFAMLSRMKYINRWGLMRNTQSENIAEHSLEVAYIAHALALIRERRLGIPCDAERAAVLAMFHDCTEIITGDMPTPIKYHSPEIRQAYREVEKLAAGNLLALLPEDLRGSYEPIFDEENSEDAELRPLVKAADKISAIIKCIEERKTGNREFVVAEEGQRRAVEEMNLPEAKIFMAEFLPAYEQSIDEYLMRR